MAKLQKFLAVIIAAGLVAGGAAACGGQDEPSTGGSGDDAGLAISEGQSSPKSQAAADAAKGAPEDASRSANAFAQAAPATAAGATTASGGNVPNLPSSQDRKVISNTSLALSVNDVAAAFNEAGRVARLNGGYTEKSSFSNRDGDDPKQRTATMTLRVPTQNYDDVLASLRAISGAKVLSEGSRSTEVTEQYTDLQSRLRNLERTEQTYLKLLEQAKTIQEILTLNDRLDGVRGQIEQIQGRLKVFDNLSDMATIDLSLSPIVPARVQPGDGPKSFQSAFADAWEASLDALRYVAAGGAIASVALIWLAVPALLVLIVTRALRHRNVPAA